ncbi:MAG: hypothetical protein GX851_03635 [Clostridiales bacterium]|nr:hypothetical protein [Clostridiales bacterium]
MLEQLWSVLANYGVSIDAIAAWFENALSTLAPLQETEILSTLIALFAQLAPTTAETAESFVS